ncbi:ArsR/SmtB family transcription factor, partial [Streptomyces sp. NPDC127118]|uniref:ArsR/SmtB family transcription factor n=1 Tax=Streptomyces sp. NPDC127118 TaxID=3345369 RepID=UPI0036337283
MDSQRAGQDVGVDLAAVSRLLADGTRAAFCLALLDGRAWTAIELARHAGVAPSTATSHLNLLVSGGLLAEERHGRHRYVRVTDRRVVELIEGLAALAPHVRGHGRLPAGGQLASPLVDMKSPRWRTADLP